MACILRPYMLRQIRNSAPLQRASNASTLSASYKQPNFQTSLTLSPALLVRPKVTQTTSKAIARVATFHTTSQRLILPPLPQRIQGTANDPAPVPAPEPTHGSYHWTFERLISAALIPLTVAPFAAGSLNPIMDATLCATILIHSHIGFESIIIDYIPTKRLPKTRTLFWWGLRAATLSVAVGLYEFETNDVGVTEAIKRIWSA